MNKDQKIALVTGANRGIGKEIAKQLAAKNVITLLSARSQKKAEEAASEISDKNIIPLKLDVNDQNSIAYVRDWIKREYGKLDILINNAGINYDTYHDASNAEINNIKETFDTNFFAVIETTQILMPMLVKARHARIINMSSSAGALNGMGGGTPGYSASKAALNVFTIKLSEEIKGKGFSVNSVCPGWVRTDMGGPNADLSVEEGADTAVWLATEAPESLTGKFMKERKERSW